MNSSEVVSMYENVANLTSLMKAAARGNDWDSLKLLEAQCAQQSSIVEASQLPPLEGADRLRKVQLLKQIMANDREIRVITEPWMNQISKYMQTAAVVR
jgi:flagellar protein FliT